MALDFDKLPERRGTHSYKWDTCEQDVIPLWVADMDFPCPQPVVDALQRRLDHPVYGYTARSDEHNKAVLGWLSRRFGWRVDDACLVAAPPGAIHAIDSLVSLFTEEGDEIILQTPGYQPLSDLVTEQGREVVANPLKYSNGSFELDIDHLKSVITPKTKMLILCSPHNPTGRVWRKCELQALLEVCRADDILVVSDEVHSDLIYRGQTHVPLGAVAGDGDRVVTVISPSKSFNTSGLPQSTLIIEDAEVRDRFRAYMNRAQLNLDSIFGSTAMIASYNECEGWLDDVMDYVEGNYEALSKFLKASLPQITAIQPEGTYLCWLDFRSFGQSQDKLYQKMLDAGVRLCDGRDFGAAGIGFFRINLACSRETLLEGLYRIRDAVSS